MIAALTFGTMMRQDFTIWLQLDYAIAFFLLLALAFGRGTPSRLTA
jgi:hypothetical protein